MHLDRSMSELAICHSLRTEMCEAQLDEVILLSEHSSF